MHTLTHSSIFNPRNTRPLVAAPLLLALALASAACMHKEPPAERAQPDDVAGSGATLENLEPQTERPPAPPPAPVAGGPDGFADLVERSRPAVINIYTRVRRKNPRRSNPFMPFAPRERLQESLGSGFLIDPNGLALTNHHVIDGATDIEVRLLDERVFKAKIVGDDPKTDVALIQLLEVTKPLPSLPLGDSEKLRVGEWLVAIGNPLGLTSTVTAGIASATGRKNVPLGAQMRYQDFIQTDASINPGNSGGPILNTRGEVMGINTAVNAEAQGIGFAIPINMVKDILGQLKDKGRVERSWLGVFIDDVPPKMRRVIKMAKGGALVRKVVPGGPAELARLASGDVILALGDEQVDDAAHLTWLAGHMEIGKVIDV
ncbi:MAG: trypsin-like peptidase domain-containing protein, partial [Myxococcota bacterium]